MRVGAAWVILGSPASIVRVSGIIIGKADPKSPIHNAKPFVPSSATKNNVPLT